CPKPRYASCASVTCPTSPVAPTSPIRGSAMRALRFGALELERRVQRLHGLLDLVARHEAADLDRRGAHDHGLDPELLERGEHLRGHSRMTLHSGSDDADLSEIFPRRPLDAEAPERVLGPRPLVGREDDLEARLAHRVDVDARLGRSPA